MGAGQADLATLLTPVTIARIHDCHPSAVVRWIQRGTPLSTGSRLRLAAVRTPGGWRVRREDLEQFLEALTADRLRPGETGSPKAAPKSARVRRMKAALQSAGFTTQEETAL
jgi:hypothetical protein